MTSRDVVWRHVMRCDVTAVWRSCRNSPTVCTARLKNEDWSKKMDERKDHKYRINRHYIINFEMRMKEKLKNWLFSRIIIWWTFLKGTFVSEGHVFVLMLNIICVSGNCTIDLRMFTLGIDFILYNEYCCIFVQTATLLLRTIYV